MIFSSQANSDETNTEQTGPTGTSTDGTEAVVSENNGHFIDRFVDNVTNLEAGDTAVEGVATGIEFVVQLGLFIVPALLIIYGLTKRKTALLLGSSAFLGFALWYRFATADWEQRQNEFLETWVIPVGDWAEQVTRWVDLNLPITLGVIEWPFRALLDVIVTNWLLELSWLTVCLGVFFLGWAIRNIRVGALSFLGLAVCGLLGDSYWIETARTIGFIGVAVLLCVIVGIPIGVLCGRVDSAWKITKPVLDAMQVVHTFVYMLPFIFFFGIGFVSATMVTMVFALPPLIRLTNLGIRQVPADVVEAARAYGAPEWRVLTDVQLPLARPALMAGLNQTMLLSISMLGIAAIMGAGGLGRLLFRAISNLDIALAGSGGLAFFLVAVVLDRLTQPVAGDKGNLLSRMMAAWSNRRTPEILLERQQAAEQAAQQPSETETPAAQHSGATTAPTFVKVGATERLPLLLTAAGSLVALAGLLLLPWAHNAGPISGYGRAADLNLAGQSFNGIAASGGNWFGVLALLGSLLAFVAAATTLIQPGKWGRWLAGDGALIFATASLIATLAYVLISPPNDAVNYSLGVGAPVTLVGLALATGAGVAWVFRSPVAEKRTLSSKVAFGKLGGGVFAALLLVIAVFAGWSYDTRSNSVITPELQEQLDQMEAEAEAAEAAGDQARAGVLASEMLALVSTAQRTGDVVLDGRSNDGTLLGIWSLLAGLLALGTLLPAAGLFGSAPLRLYRWSSIASGISLGLAVIGGAWILSLVRTADDNFVSGVGAVFVLAAGGTLFAAVNATASTFERKRQYAQMRQPAATTGGTANGLPPTPSALQEALAD